jgi:hypothetical protein
MVCDALLIGATGSGEARKASSDGSLSVDKMSTQAMATNMRMSQRPRCLIHHAKLQDSGHVYRFKPNRDWGWQTINVSPLVLRGVTSLQSFFFIAIEFTMHSVHHPLADPAKMY